MFLRAVYDGGADPFEGTRELVLRRLPAGARVLAARATVTPIDPSGGGDPFAEEIRFPGPGARVGDWGATQVRGAGFAEIDFHARRTLAGMRGINLDGGRLHVDLGGTFLGIDELGGLANPAGPPFLVLGDDGPLPGIAASRLRITAPPPVPPSPPTPAVAAVRIRSVPSNVTLALASRTALWFHAGELATPETTPDWGNLLTAYLLEGAEVADGVYVLPFVLRSDTIARLGVALEIEYVRTSPLLPAGLPAVKLDYDLATVPRAGAPPLAVALPAAAVPVAAACEGHLAGAFAETRIAWDPTGAIESPGTVAPPGRQSRLAGCEVVLSPSRSAAQPLALPERAAGYEVVAIDLLVAAVDRQVKLTLDLRVDGDRKPGAGSLLAAPVPFELTRASAGGATWLSVELPRPLTLREPTDRKAWLLLQSAEGEATWSAGVAAPAALPLQVSADGGFSYRAFAAESAAPLAARFRLREKPAGFRLPLAAEFGTGVGAVRVDLSRLTPLGKVDFDLSIPEIAAGISAVLERARAASGGAPGGPGTELLADPSFARWAVDGDELRAVRPLRLDQATAFALGHFARDRRSAFIARVGFAPDGRHAYVVLDASEKGAATFVVWDTEANEIAWRLDPDLGSSRGLAVDPGGRFAYVLSELGVAIVDLRARRLVGGWLRVDARLPPPVAIAASSDGLRLAIALEADDDSDTTASIAIYNVEMLVGLARRRAPDGSGAKLLNTPLAAGQPVAMVFSGDGARLYLLTAEVDKKGNQDGEISVHDAGSLLQLEHALFDGAPRAFAVSPDGRAIFVLHPSRLDRYDAGTLALVGSLKPADEDLWALAIEPGGRRALVVGAGGLRVVALEPGGMRSAMSLEGVGPSQAVAVSPRGDRAVAIPLATAPSKVFSTSTARPDAFLIPIGIPHPLDWTLTAGRALPLTLTGSSGRGVSLGEVAGTPAAARLARPPVASAVPLGPSSLSQVVPAAPGRSYEFSFHGWAGDQARAEVVWRDAEGGRVGAVATPICLPAGGAPTFHRATWIAPAGAIAAEVRFITEAGRAEVGQSSFREPQNVLAHGDLRQQAIRAGAWRQEPAFAPGFLISEQASGSRVSNSGVAPVALRQEVGAEAGMAFELTASANSESGPPGRIEVRFLAPGGGAIGPASVIEIGRHGFDSTLAAGVVPENTVRAEVTLFLAPGAALRLDDFALRFERRIEVPLTFLAEAPGELAVIGGAIAWDLPEIVSAPPRPGPGQPPLPSPTPPPGATGEEEACGGDDGSAGASSTPAAPPAPAPAPALATPLDAAAIVGIGPRRAEILRAQGISTLEALLATDPRKLALILPTVSEGMAVGFIRQAREALGRR